MNGTGFSPIRGSNLGQLEQIETTVDKRPKSLPATVGRQFLNTLSSVKVLIPGSGLRTPYSVLKTLPLDHINYRVWLPVH